VKRFLKTVKNFFEFKKKDAIASFLTLVKQVTAKIKISLQ
jgi:hypothetical protein